MLWSPEEAKGCGKDECKPTVQYLFNETLGVVYFEANPQNVTRHSSELVTSSTSSTPSTREEHITLDLK
jgi:hypothetical protein